jgi:hypothetical protein
MAQLQASTWVMNLDVWNSFPAELQDFITQANVKAAYDIWEGYLDIEAKAGELIAEGEEIHTNDISSLEPIAREQRAAYIAALPESAPDSVENPQGFIDDYQARIGYWTDALVEDGYEVTERTPEAILDAFAGLSEVDLSGFYEKFNSEVTPGLMN